VKPVYVNSGGTLVLRCELDYPYNLQWHRALFQDPTVDSGRGRPIYTKVDTSSENGFIMTARITDGRGSTTLTKYNVTVFDAGSYKCSRTNDPQMSYAVDVNVLQGKTHRQSLTHSFVNILLSIFVLHT